MNRYTFDIEDDRGEFVIRLWDREGGNVLIGMGRGRYLGDALLSLALSLGARTRQDWQ